jgi:chaperonin GroES
VIRHLIKPLREQILVELADPEEKTFGGIIIPETAQEKPRKATVIAVGEGWHNEKNTKVIPLGVKPGDKILIGTNMKGTDLTLRGKKYEMIRENYIFAVLT